jgi:KxxxW cyclic peptide radical SAM maturase
VSFYFNRDFTLNIEGFGGLLLSRGGTPAWELDAYHTCFLKTLALTGNYSFALKMPELLMGNSDFQPNLTYLQIIGAVKKGQELNRERKHSDTAAVIDLLKAEFDEARLRRGLKAPTTLTLYPSMQCQQKCNFCFLSKAAKNNQSLPDVSHWLDLIREAKELGVSSIALLGGEPTLYPGLTSIIKVCQEVDVNLGITSNGIHVPPAAIEAVRDHHNTMFCFSLVSLNSERHRRHTGVSNRHVIDTICSFGEEQIPFNVNTIGIGQSLQELKDLADFCANKGARVWFLNMYFLKGRMPDLFPGLPWYTRVNAVIEEYVRAHYGDRLAYQMFGCQLYWTYPNEQIKRGPASTHYNQMIRGCAAGINQLEVLPDGTALPCIQMDPNDFACGNVFRDGLKAVWTRSPLLEILRCKEPPANDLCRQCDWLVTCNGGCRARRHLTLKSFGEDMDLRCPLFKSNNPSSIPENWRGRGK